MLTSRQAWVWQQRSYWACGPSIWSWCKFISSSGRFRETLSNKECGWLVLPSSRSYICTIFAVLPSMLLQTLENVSPRLKHGKSAALGQRSVFCFEERSLIYQLTIWVTLIISTGIRRLFLHLECLEGIEDEGQSGRLFTNNFHATYLQGGGKKQQDDVHQLAPNASKQSADSNGETS